MKEFTKKMYKCDHCGKWYHTKRGCENHEKVCVKNPENWRPCYGCQYLDKKNETIYYDCQFGISESQVRLLHCSKKNLFLYPPQVEIKGNAICSDSLDNEQNDPMPKECKFREEQGLEWH